MSVAALLVAVPNVFETMQRNAEPLSAGTVAGVVYEVEVAPEMFTAFFCHWYARVDPVAVTENIAVVPALTS